MLVLRRRGTSILLVLRRRKRHKQDARLWKIVDRNRNSFSDQFLLHDLPHDFPFAASQATPNPRHVDARPVCDSLFCHTFEPLTNRLITHGWRFPPVCEHHVAQSDSPPKYFPRQGQIAPALTQTVREPPLSHDTHARYCCFACGHFRNKARTNPRPHFPISLQTCTMIRKSSPCGLVASPITYLISMLSLLHKCVASCGTVRDAVRRFYTEKSFLRLFSRHLIR